MSKYGELACMAAASCNRGVSPRDAWERNAKKVFPTQEASRKKGCPKSTFLGLAEEGLIVGVKPGHYTTSKKNKKYAIRAHEILCSNESLAADPIALWTIVMDGDQKVPNEQMEVVISLWKKGLIVKTT